MPAFSSYCEAIKAGAFSEKHAHYHDTEYGFPVTDDNELFGRLLLEINQAGLSWNTVLNKKESIRAAYANFDINTVASFTEDDILQLLENPGIIRMRKKIEAAIYNAQQLQILQKEYGSFKNWLDTQHPKNKEEWVKCFKQRFKFTGNEITKEFLMGTGYIKGAHITACPIYNKVLKHQPKWLGV